MSTSGDELSTLNSVTEKRIKQQLDFIVRNLKTDYEIWKQCDSAGWTLVTEVSKECEKLLTRMDNNSSMPTRHFIRRGLLELQRLQRLFNVPFQRLVLLVDRLLDATASTRESINKVRQMCASNDELVEKIFYRDWQLKDILGFAEYAIILYDSEYEVKELLLEEFASCRTREEVSAKRQAWLKSKLVVTTGFEALFKQFDLETREIKATV